MASVLAPCLKPVPVPRLIRGTHPLGRRAPLSVRKLEPSIAKPAAEVRLPTVRALERNLLHLKRV